MSNRVIKESLLSSPQVDSLTWFEQAVYVRLILAADEDSLIDGRSIVLKNRLFPSRTDITCASMEKAISKLIYAGLAEETGRGGVKALRLTDCGLSERVAPRPPAKARKQADSTYSPAFERFWAAYPRKIAKPKAAAAFEAYAPDEALLRQMLEAIERQKQSAQWRENRGQFIPHPTTWLNQRRWEDAPDEPDAEPEDDRMEDWGIWYADD